MSQLKVDIASRVLLLWKMVELLIEDSYLKK